MCVTLCVLNNGKDVSALHDLNISVIFVSLDRSYRGMFVTWLHPLNMPLVVVTAVVSNNATSVMAEHPPKVYSNAVTPVELAPRTDSKSVWLRNSLFQDVLT